MIHIKKILSTPDMLGLIIVYTDEAGVEQIVEAGVVHAAKEMVCSGDRIYEIYFECCSDVSGGSKYYKEMKKLLEKK